MSDSFPSILQTWLHPLGLTEFLERQWTREAYWTYADSERLRFTQKLLPGSDLSILLEHSMDPIKVWYLDGTTPVYSLQLGRTEALHAYRAGLTLYFGLDLSVSGKLILLLSRELARPPMGFKVSVFASRSGSLTMPHVDGHENFTLQLRGKKRWKISPGMQWPGIQEKLQANPNSRIQDLFRIFRPPDSWNDVQSIEMTPGAFLYCPAEFWHTVETCEDSLSLNVSIARSYTWSDAILPAIRSALMRKDLWNSPAVGLWSSENHRQQAEKTASMLLNRLSEDLRKIDPDDFLAAWNVAEGKPLPDVMPQSFVRNEFVSCQIISADIGNEFSVRIESTVRPQGKTQVLTFPWKFYLPFLELMSDCVVRPAAQFQEARELLAELLRYGVLRARDTSSKNPL